MPIVTSDIVILTVRDGELLVGLSLRDREPFEGRLALPGVWIREDEDAEQAALRAAREKGGMDLSHIEQLETFSGPRRDPRGWSASVAYLALVRNAEDSDRITFVPVEDAIDLPFDHADIVASAVYRIRGKGAYSTLPLGFLPETFTVREMEAIYNTVLKTDLHDSVLRRDVLELVKDGVLIEASEKRPGSASSKRPAKLYRLAGMATLDKKIGKRGE